MAGGHRAGWGGVVGLAWYQEAMAGEGGGVEQAPCAEEWGKGEGQISSSAPVITGS